MPASTAEQKRFELVPLVRIDELLLVQLRQQAQRSNVAAKTNRKTREFREKYRKET